MASIFLYSDYREYIKDVLEEKRKKNPAFSYRCAASRIGMSSGSFTRIINGTRRLGSHLLPKLVDFLKLKRREAEYFSLLVKFDTLTDDGERYNCFKEISKLRSECNSIIPEQGYKIFEEWYYIVLHELLRIIPDTRDYQKLGSLILPAISETKVRKAIQLLESCGYIKIDEQGRAKPGKTFLTTGDTWNGMAIHAFQAAMSEMAVKALNNTPKEERDFSTLTVPLSENAFEKVREVIRKARQEIAAIEKECESPDRVYQINFQCFPLSKPIEKEDRNNGAE